MQPSERQSLSSFNTLKVISLCEGERQHTEVDEVRFVNPREAERDLCTDPEKPRRQGRVLPGGALPVVLATDYRTTAELSCPLSEARLHAFKNKLANFRDITPVWQDFVSSRENRVSTDIIADLDRDSEVQGIRQGIELGEWFYIRAVSDLDRTRRITGWHQPRGLKSEALREAD